MKHFTATIPISTQKIKLKQIKTNKNKNKNKNLHIDAGGGIQGLVHYTNDLVWPTLFIIDPCK